MDRCPKCGWHHTDECMGESMVADHNPTIPRTRTPILIAAMRLLAQEIQSEDGVANAAIAEAADRLEELAHIADGNSKLIAAQRALGESLRSQLIQTLIDSQTKALSIACAALGKPTASAKSEITEEWSDDGKTITVYPCPKCGNSEPDWDASMAAKVKKLAEDFGWDGMCPLLDWLGNCLTDLNEAKK